MAATGWSDLTCVVTENSVAEAREGMGKVCTESIQVNIGRIDSVLTLTRQFLSMYGGSVG